MINLLLGAPGGGKTYEAVAYHVIPALSQGRLVVTNLPLVLEEVAKLEPQALSLLKVVTSAKVIPFADLSFYSDPWRHPDTGTGPLYVIDECHKALPKGETRREVEEWFAEHRHESADVLLITQSYGKISQAIRDAVQIVYRVRKNIAFGSDSSYTRKVQDGLRGEVMNTAIRRYQKRYFRLYQSRTKGGGSELGANDIVPIWRHWTFYGVGLAAVILIGMVITKGNVFNPFPETPPSLPMRSVEYKAGKPVNMAQVTPEPSPAPKPEPVPQDKAKRGADIGGPFQSLGIHIAARMKSATKDRYTFAMSQNGQRVFYATSVDLIEAGYLVTALTDCAVKLTYEGLSRYAVCDAPAQSVQPVLGTGPETPAMPSNEGSRQGGTPLAGGTMPGANGPT